MPENEPPVLTEFRTALLEYATGTGPERVIQVLDNWGEDPETFRVFELFVTRHVTEWFHWKGFTPPSGIPANGHGLLEAAFTALAKWCTEDWVSGHNREVRRWLDAIEVYRDRLTTQGLLESDDPRKRSMEHKERSLELHELWLRLRWALSGHE